MAAVDFAKIKPGTTLSCKVAKAPRTPDQAATIERLMRLDPTAKKALRRAQRLRRQRLVVYNRGNRDWVKREKPARVVHATTGATWSLPFNLALVPDLKAVEKFLTVSAT